jgi:RNA polymerase sigma factor for flagellar operon FliA
VRGAMIDALRKDAWPRGVRRVRRELEAARERLRLSLGHEPSLADLAAAVGSDEERLGKVIVRINTIEQTSPLSCADNIDESQLPAVLVPVEAERPDAAYERREVQARVRGAIASLPPRERRVIALYYYGEVTMKEIGAELGVNESRVSQLHARALRRLREALGPDATPIAAMAAIRQAVVAFEHRPKMAKASLPESDTVVPPAAVERAERGIVIDYASASRAARSKSPSRKGLESHRQPLSSRKRSASVPATSPVTKMTRRASAGVAAVMAL